MAWITDSLRSAIAAVNPFQRYQSQAPLQGIFTSQLAVAAYLGSGMLRKVIQIPAADRVREWRDWQAENEQIEAIEAEEKRLGLVAKVRQAEVLRGIGGGALILVTAGDHSQPLSPDSIRKGGLIAINVVNRWELQPRDFDKNLASPTYGQPRMFYVNGGEKTQQPIHPSRVICFRGDPLPSTIGIGEEDAFWGDSRLVRVMSEVNKADNASLWFSELVKKAKLLRIGIPNLAEMSATEGGKAKLAARVETIAMGENLLNATVFSAAANKDSAGETISDYQVTWAGIPAMMDAFDQRVAAVADIPFTRLMGRSPAGMNATGEHDSANYHAMVAAGQELELRPCLEQLDAVLLPSAGVPREGLWWKFSPLGKPTPKEEADRFSATMTALKTAAELNAMPDQAFNAGVQGVIEENGWLPGSLPILAAMSEEERFGIAPDDDGTDPSALQAEGGDPDLADDPAGDGSAGRRRAANDAKPIPLYVQRKLLNADELIRWAKTQGFKTTLEPSDMHVTVLYSRTPVDPIKMGTTWADNEKGELTVKPGGPRAVERLGEEAVVLLFASDDLSWRHRGMVEAGASHDYDEYQPHVTLTYDAGDVDLDAIKPFTGALRFGPELFEPLDLDWKSKLTEE